MKFTLSWLKEHLDTDEPLEKLADKLTMIGLEVENIEDKAKALAPFSIARVISAEQHPNADRLSVCQVDAGSGAPLTIVCGAPNVKAGIKVPCALVGAELREHAAQLGDDCGDAELHHPHALEQQLAVAHER